MSVHDAAMYSLRARVAFSHQHPCTIARPYTQSRVATMPRNPNDIFSFRYIQRRVLLCGSNKVFFVSIHEKKK